MSSAAGTLETIALELSKIFSPLKDISGASNTELQTGTAASFLRELGLNISDAQESALVTPFSTTADKVTQLLGKTKDLIAAIDAENISDIISISGAVIGLIKDIITGFTAIKNALVSAGIPSVDASVIPEKMMNYLLHEYIEKIPGLNPVLEFLNILEVDEHNVGSTDPLNPPFNIYTFHFDEIGNWLSNAGNQMKTLYNWGADTFDGKTLLDKTDKILTRLNLPSLYDSVANKLDTGLVEVVPKTDISPKGLLFTVKSAFTSGTQTVNGDDWNVQSKVDVTLPTNAGIIVQSNGKISIQPPDNTDIHGEVSLVWTAHKQNDDAFVLIGEAGGSRFEIGTFIIGVSTKLTWDIANSKANGEFKIEGSINKCKVIINASGADGFLATLLPSSGFEADFDLTLGISSTAGFYIGGSSSFEINLPLHVQLGPITLDGFSLSIKPANGQIPIGLAASLTGSLGPIEVAIQDIGAKAIFSFPPNNSGNLGPAQLDIGFLPPKGVGLSIDASVVKGGGFILFDPDKGEYAGALQLSIEDTIQVSAIAIINTKMPDGSKGFSLLIIISVSFEPGISLSMGFFLSGLGGMLGINRTINVDALRDGVKNDAIEQIMFPQDIIANINTLLPQIKSIFPIKQDQFMIGLMAKITWGVPSLVTIEFGLCIEFTNPVRLAILGVLKIVLPTEDAAILQLQVNFVGIIDFDNGYLSFDASIYNSHILTFTLEGDMALRLNWGNEKAFLMSVGGFHPSFKPPASLNVPKLKRLTLTILSPNPNLVLTAYFAVTSNTVQFGARIDFKFEAGGFSVVGYLGFDVLFQFSPFKFIADITAGLEVKMGGSTLFSINLDFELSGPTPWNANGTASFSILFFSFSVHFNVTWGDAQQVILPGIAVLPKILEAFNLDANWTAELPANRYNLVALASIVPKPGQIILQAFGAVKVSQIIMPLKLVIDKFGNNTPSDINMVDISAFRLGGLDTGLNDEAESFAPSAYKNMSDDDKLKSPSYTKEKGGVKVSDTDTLFVDYAWDRDVVYDVKVSDFDPFPQPATFNFDFKWFKLMVNGGAIGRSALSKQNSQKNFRLNNAAVNMGEEQFVLIDNSTLAQHSANVFAGGTHAQANDAFETIIKQNPSLKGKVSIASAYQLN